jgi:hypothetical protein
MKMGKANNSLVQELTKEAEMKIKILVITLMLMASSVFAEKIPSQVKKSVVFIFVKDSSKRLLPQGTGFFVLLKTNQNTDTANFGYLVTSKNTLKKLNGSFFDSVYIRINRKDGNSDTLNIPLIQNGVLRYFLHPDSSVDLAVIPAYPDLNRYDFLFLPVGMIAPIDFIKKENFTEGDDVFHIGMLDTHIGIFKNIPIVRFGKIVQMSEEKYLSDNIFKELYLVETAISKGSNGSPLYYYTPAVRDTGNLNSPAKLYLTGIIADQHIYGNQNNGLVDVVPAYKLLELLTQPMVIQEREKEFTRIQKVKSK